MEVQALIERRDKLQDDIREAAVNLIKEFELETGFNIKAISVNGTSIDVIHHHPLRASAEIVANKDKKTKEVFFNTSIGLGI